MASDLERQWEATKAEFKTITGKRSKPKEEVSFLKIATSHTGLSGSLKNFDKACNEAEATSARGKWDDLPDDIKTVEKAAKAFHTAAVAYIQVLDKEIRVASADAEAGDKTAYEKGLKVLKAKLKAFDAIMAQKIDGLRVALTQVPARQMADALMVKALKASIAKAIVVIKEIKATPTPQLYNTKMGTAARDVIMQLVVAEGQANRGTLPPTTVTPTVAKQKLQPWNTAQPNSRVPDDATPEQIIAAIKDFSGELKFAQRIADDLT